MSGAPAVTLTWVGARGLFEGGEMDSLAGDQRSCSSQGGKGCEVGNGAHLVMLWQKKFQEWYHDTKI